MTPGTPTRAVVFAFIRLECRIRAAAAIHAPIVCAETQPIGQTSFANSAAMTVPRVIAWNVIVVACRCHCGPIYPVTLPRSLCH